MKGSHIQTSTTTTTTTTATLLPPLSPAVNVTSATSQKSSTTPRAGVRTPTPPPTNHSKTTPTPTRTPPAAITTTNSANPSALAAASAAMSGGLTAEARVAMQDILRELELTRKEFAKASVQLTHQETLIAHLKDEEVKKDAIIAHLEDELKNVDTFHQQELAVSSEEAKSRDLELEHKNRYLELEVARLTEENNIYSRYETENAEIRQKVISLQEQVDQLQRLNDELRNRATDDMSEFRGQLEEEFKRRLLESEKHFQAEAYHALSEEAKIALQGNDHLQTMLQKQNDAIEVVLQRCKQLESAHTRMRMEQELSQQSVVYQQGEMAKVRRQLSQSQARCEELENSLKQRRIERASLELLYMEYESTRKELTTTTERLRRTQRGLDRWKSRSIGLAKETLLLRQQLQQNQQESPMDFPVNLEQKQKRGVRAAVAAATSFRKSDPNSSRRALSQQLQAELHRAKLHSSGSASSGGSSSSSSEGEEPQYPSDWEPAPSGILPAITSNKEEMVTATSAPHKVDPMTILSMWNVNYETWRSPYDEASGVAGVEGEGEGEGEGMMGVAAAGQELLSTLDTAPNPSGGIPHPPLQVPMGGGGGPQSKASKQPSVADTRLRKDRELSVLSKRRIKFMPPQRGSLTVVRTTKVAAQAAVASLGATQGSATATINSATSGTKSVLANTMTTITSGSSDGVKSGTDVPTRKASKSAFLQTEIFFSTKSPALHKNRFIVP